MHRLDADHRSPPRSRGRQRRRRLYPLHWRSGRGLRATAGPGFANVYSSLCNAAADRVPVLVITSSAPLRKPSSTCCRTASIRWRPPRVGQWAHRVTTVARVARSRGTGGQARHHGRSGPRGRHPDRHRVQADQGGSGDHPVAGPSAGTGTVDGRHRATRRPVESGQAPGDPDRRRCVG